MQISYKKYIPSSTAVFTRRILSILLLHLLFTISSCKKENDFVPAASLNVINASPGISSAQVQTPYATGYFNQLIEIGYGSNFVFNIPTGKVGIGISTSVDTTKPAYTTQLTTNGGDIYSYFIAGSAGEDIISNKDVIPVIADSSFGLRFINCSYNSDPVNVTLSTSSGSNEFSAIAYKSLTGFKNYSARAADPSTYTFEVWDGNGNQLATLDVATPNYVKKNITLVFQGIIGASGSTSPGLFIVNNF